MNWATIKNWNFVFEMKVKPLVVITYHWKISIFWRDVTLDNGLSLQADPKKGTPIVKFFNSHLGLGSSSYKLEGAFVAELVAFISNILKMPIQVFINTFFEPGANFFINNIFIPNFLQGGFLKLNTDFQGQDLGPIIIDSTLPQNP